MKGYYRIIAGAGSQFAAQCIDGSFIGVDYKIDANLAEEGPETLQAFNTKFIPIYLQKRPDASRVTAGLACGYLWAISKSIQQGDIVLSPDGAGRYHVGAVSGPYFYAPGQILPHRRPMRWFPTLIDKNDMSDSLRRSMISGVTVCNLGRLGHGEEIECLIGGSVPAPIPATAEAVEDAAAFAMEKHLEDFLVENWAQTDLGRLYDIYTEDGELVGQQYPTDTGPLDILAISKDRKKLLVVELKRGKASDAVVGQTLRYMGYVQETLAEEGQTVEGVIVALEDDNRIRRALSMTPSIQFYRYEISFKLVKG